MVKKLLFAILFIASIGKAQQGNVPPIWVTGPVAPASCSGVQLFYNITNGSVGSCQSGVFVTFSASTGATITGTPVGGNIAIFSSSTAITNGNISGDCTTAGSAAITCTKTSGTSFATSATTDTTNAANITSGIIPLARLPLVPFSGLSGSLLIGQTPLNTNQGILYDNAGALAQLPISTVNVGFCLGNSGGIWTGIACTTGNTTLLVGGGPWYDVTSTTVGGVADGKIGFGGIVATNTFLTSSGGTVPTVADAGKTISIDGAGIAAPTFNPGTGGSALAVSTETIATFSTKSGIPCNTTGPGSDTLVIALTAITENGSSGMVTSESPPSNYQLTNAINVTSASCTGLNGVVKITPPTVMPTGATGYSVYSGTVGLNGTAPACATVTVSGACPDQIKSDPAILSNWARQSKYIGPYIRQPVCLLGSSSTVVNPICFNQSTLNDPTTSSLGNNYSYAYTLACVTLSTTGYGCAPTSVSYLYANGQFDAQPPSSSVLMTTITSVSGSTVNIADAALSTNANAQISWGTDNGAKLQTFIGTGACTTAGIATAGCEIRFPPAAACYYFNNSIFSRDAGFNVGSSSRIKLIGYGHTIGTGTSPSTLCAAGRFPIAKWGIQTQTNGTTDGSTIGGGAYNLGWRDISNAGGSKNPGCIATATISCGNVPAAIEVFGVQSMDFDKNQCATFGVGACVWTHGTQFQLADRTNYGDISCVSSLDSPSSGYTAGGCAFGFYGPDDQTDSKIGPGLENNVGNAPINGNPTPYSWGKAGIYLGNDPFTTLNTSGFFITNLRSGSNAYGLVVFDSNNVNILQDKFEINTGSQAYTAVQIDGGSTPYNSNVKGGSLYGGFANNWVNCLVITSNVTTFYVDGLGTSCANPFTVSSNCPFCSVVPSGVSQFGSGSPNLYKMIPCNNGQGQCVLVQNRLATDPLTIGDCVATLTNDNAGRDCPITATGIQVGIAASQNGVVNNLMEVQVNGIVIANLDGVAQATTTGDFVCVGTTTAGLAHENSTTPCTAGKQLGIVAHTTTSAFVCPNGIGLGLCTPIWISIK